MATPVAAVHLPCATAWNDGLDRQFADNRASPGLTVEQLPHLTADFGIYTEDFSHKGFLSLIFVVLSFQSSWRCPICAPVRLGFERRGKNKAAGNNGVWICPLSVLILYG